MNNISRLEKWFAAQPSEWQNDFGVEIGTVDNPGWSVKIDLNNTPLATKEFKAVRHGIAIGGEELERMEKESNQTFNVTKLTDGTLYGTKENDWLECDVKNSVFVGAGDARKLDKILGIFLDWAESAN